MYRFDGFEMVNVDDVNSEYNNVYRKYKEWFRVGIAPWIEQFGNKV